MSFDASEPLGEVRLPEARPSLRRQLQHIRGGLEEPLANRRRVRRILEMGNHRIIATEEAGRTAIEVLELLGGRWRLVEGPHIFPAGDQAQRKAEALEAGLQHRMLFPWSYDE